MAERVTVNTPLVPPSLLARFMNVSPERIAEAAKELRIDFATTPTRRSLASFRQVVQISQLIDSRARK